MEDEYVSRLIEQASELLDQGDLSGAEKSLKEALKYDERNAEACLLIGSIYGEMQRTDEAINFVGRAVELDQDNPAAYLTLGHIQRSIGQPREALASFERAVKRDDTDAESWCTLANMQLELDSPDQAAESLRNAIDNDPYCLTAWLMSGWTHRNTDNAEMAAGAFRKALEIEPDNPEATAGLGNLLAKDAKYDEAEVLFRSAIARHPKVADLRFRFGLVMLQKGNYVLAREEVEHALALDPDNQQYLPGLANICARRGEFDEAFDILQPLLEADNVSFEAIFVFATICEFHDMREECLLLLDTVPVHSLDPGQKRQAEEIRRSLSGN